MERTKFKTLEQLERRISQVMDSDYKYNGHVFNPTWNGWKFEFDRAVRRLGCCNYQKKTISLSRKMCEENLENWLGIYDILLHEISHAFNRYIHQWKADNHGPKFKAIAKTLGCHADASVSVKENNLNLNYSKYMYICPVCKKEYRRQRKIYDSSCSACSQHYDPKFKLILKTS